VITTPSLSNDGSQRPPRNLSRRAFLWITGLGAASGAFFLYEQLKTGGGAAGRRAGVSSVKPSAPSTTSGRGVQQARPAATAGARVVEYPVAPYISKAVQLDALPWNTQSFYKQPWRGYLETISAEQLLSGIGINYNLPGNANHEAVIRLLADSGFRSIRLEIGWGNVGWSEATLNNGSVYQQIFAACRRHGITPLILLNANEGLPGPNQASTRTIVAGGDLGSRQVQLNDVTGLIVGRSGISNLTHSFMAEAMITSISGTTKTIQLSKPLPKVLPSGSTVPVHTLKYLPLYPVGTPQFDETAAGWLRYVELVLGLAAANGLRGLDVEIWNELTFGSAYLSINNYYQPAVASFKYDAFRQGGQAWELARRTINYVNQKYPGTKPIWGFSNTSFFHTAAQQLPPTTNGQSYHPYGTGRRLIQRDFPPANRYSWYVEHYIPNNLSWCMPEGWAHLGVQTEFLPRLLNPVTRSANVPPSTPVFRHFITEHGFLPTAAGISDPHQALTYKAKSTIRALLFWLNKGIAKLEIYSAYDRSDLAMGLLFAQPDPRAYANYFEQQLMSPPLQAVKNVIAKFADAQPLGRTRQLAVDVAAIGPQPAAFNGAGSHPPLYYREMFTFLPFQVHSTKFVCAVYVMSYDTTSPPPPVTFRLWVRNVSGNARVSLYDPISNQPVPITVMERQSAAIRVQFQAVDYPRLLTFNE
jgi:hypothetical protein